MLEVRTWFMFGAELNTIKISNTFWACAAIGVVVGNRTIGLYYHSHQSNTNTAPLILIQSYYHISQHRWYEVSHSAQPGRLHQDDQAQPRDRPLSARVPLRVGREGQQALRRAVGVQLLDQPAGDAADLPGEKQEGAVPDRAVSQLLQSMCRATQISFTLKKSDTMEEFIAEKLSKMLAARASQFEIVRRKPIKVAEDPLRTTTYRCWWRLPTWKPSTSTS